MPSPRRANISCLVWVQACEEVVPWSSGAKHRTVGVWQTHLVAWYVMSLHGTATAPALSAPTCLKRLADMCSPALACKLQKSLRSAHQATSSSTSNRVSPGRSENGMGLGSRPMHFARARTQNPRPPSTCCAAKKERHQNPDAFGSSFLGSLLPAACQVGMRSSLLSLCLLSCRQDPEATKCTSLTQHLIPKHPPSTWARPAPRKQVGNPEETKTNWHQLTHPQGIVRK